MLVLPFLWLFYLLILPILKGIKRKSGRGSQNRHWRKVMATSQFIPVGRTSLVKKGHLALQVQTEYAYRPYARITTTISTEGRVIHKVERKLDHAIDSAEEQASLQRYMAKQHDEVIAVLNETSLEATMGLVDSQPDRARARSLQEAFRDIPGIERVFRLDNDGNFVGEHTTREFKRAFAPVFKSLRELMDVFCVIPGSGGARERGVYEVEQGRLYFASSGKECFFIIADPFHSAESYEHAIREVLNHTAS